MGPFVGVVEIVCGALILLGLFTRLAAIPLIINMLVAILSTKIPILLGYGFWGFSLRSVPYGGFWGMAHEARTDWSMLLGSIFLLIVGAGWIIVGPTPSFESKGPTQAGVEDRRAEEITRWPSRQNVTRRKMNGQIV